MLVITFGDGLGVAGDLLQTTNLQVNGPSLFPCGTGSDDGADPARRISSLRLPHWLDVRL
jgi:hypothetical protein